MRNTNVVLKKCMEYDSKLIATCLKDGFNLLGGLESFIKPNQTVLIKADLYHSTEPNIAKTTNPNVVSALAELIGKIGARCIIADSPKGDFGLSKLDNVYVKTKMLEASNNGDATLNTNDEISVISNPNGEKCREIYIMDAINDVDVIINVGKFRCEQYLGLIGCSQNLFGLVPGKFKELIKSRCYTLNAYYNYNIDLYEALENKVVLNVLDGVVGCEANNDPRILNTILVGENPYAIDCVALKIINQTPEDSLLLNECVRRQKLNFDFKILGDNIEPLVCSDFNYSVFTENIKKGSNSYFKKEYNSRQKRPEIPAKLCKGCKTCVSTCPMKAIEMQHSQLGEYAVINFDKCVNCFKCVSDCPYKIIKTKTPIKYKHIDKIIKNSQGKKSN